MKICYVHSTFIPHMGGIERHIFEISRRLAKKHEVHIITSKLNGTPSYELMEGVHVHRLPAIVIPIYNAPLIIDSITAVRKKLEEIKPNIIHIHTRWAFGSVLGTYKYIMKTKTKVVFTWHNVIGECSSWLKPIAIPFDKICIKRLRFCNKTIVQTDFLYNMLRDHGTPERHLVKVASGFNTPYNSFKESSSKSIVFVGRLVESKGLSTLLHAAQIVLQKIPDATFNIIGKGTDSIKLKAMATALELNGNVKFLGFLPDDKKNEIISQAAVSVLPSHKEALGLVNLEAMSLGKPVVASNVGGVSEFVIDGKTGFLVPPKDPKKLAEKIILLLENKTLREKMGEAGLAMAKRFTWDRAAKETEAVYKSLL